MVWDAHTKTHTNPLADEWEHAMGFRTGTTATSSLSKDQRCFVWAKPWISILWCGLLVFALQLYCLVSSPHVVASSSYIGSDK